jgi:hypothetical protein
MNIEKIKNSPAKSFSREKIQTNIISSKVSPYATSPVFESPSAPGKYSLSSEKNMQSPLRGIKKMESPTDKKVAPRKLTK